MESNLKKMFDFGKMERFFVEKVLMDTNHLSRDTRFLNIDF